MFERGGGKKKPTLGINREAKILASPDDKCATADWVQRFATDRFFSVCQKTRLV